MIKQSKRTISNKQKASVTCFDHIKAKKKKNLDAILLQQMQIFDVKLTALIYTVNIIKACYVYMYIKNICSLQLSQMHFPQCIIFSGKWNPKCRTKAQRDSKVKQINILFTLINKHKQKADVAAKLLSNKIHWKTQRSKDERL